MFNLSKPNNTALICGSSKLSYKDLDSLAGKAYAEIIEAGYKTGDVLGVWTTRSEKTPVILYTLLRAGIPFVPLNPSLGAKEEEHILADANPALVISADGHKKSLEVKLDGKSASLPDEPDEKNLAIILYTSGTTGLPKGVPIKRSSMKVNLDDLAEAWKLSGDDTIVHALPLFHIHGLILGLAGSFRKGACLHWLPKFNELELLKGLSDRNGVLFAVPTMYHRLAKAIDTDSSLASHVKAARLLVSGSAALAEADQTLIETASESQIYERYGLSETMINCAVPFGEARKGYVGPVLPSLDLKLLAEDGSEITTSNEEEIGEICVRGPQVFSGYLNHEKSPFDSEGFFNTGDLAVRGKDNFLRIVGRKSSDLIKSGGFKIGALEIENVLLNYPGVSEVAVIGQPCSDLGERIVAFIVKNEGAGDPVLEEVQDFVCQQLSSHKRPRELKMVEALPRNAMGKIQKKLLAN